MVEDNVLAAVGVKRCLRSAPEIERRRRRRVMLDSSSAAIQKIYLACKAAFKSPGAVPAPADCAALQRVLDDMQPEDVGLSKDLVFFKSTRTPANRTLRITYTTIHRCDSFSMVLFFMPAGAVIPLHDHPEMTVFTKLLMGKMHARAYDWVGEDRRTKLEGGGEPRLAEMVVDAYMTAPCSSAVLYPSSGGNMHEFTAITPCVLVDVLGPSFSDDCDSTYYRDLSSIPDSGQRLVASLPPAAATEPGEEDRPRQQKRLRWLEQIKVPKELKMDGIEYLGPQIRDMK